MDNKEIAFELTDLAFDYIPSDADPEQVVEHVKQVYQEFYDFLKKHT